MNNREGELDAFQFEWLSPFKPSYLRTYRRSSSESKKNLRCFPCCGPQPGVHSETGFCGTTVRVRVKVPTIQDDLSFYAEFSLKDSPVAFNRGEQVELRMIESRLRTANERLRPWLQGKVQKEVDSFVVTFNEQLHGYHYGWLSTKSTYNAEHVLRVYIVRSSQNHATFMQSFDSPSFQVLTRRGAKTKAKVATMNNAGAGQDSEETNLNLQEHGYLSLKRSLSVEERGVDSALKTRVVSSSSRIPENRTLDRLTNFLMFFVRLNLCHPSTLEKVENYLFSHSVTTTERTSMNGDRVSHSLPRTRIERIERSTHEDYLTAQSVSSEALDEGNLLMMCLEDSFLDRDRVDAARLENIFGDSQIDCFQTLRVSLRDEMRILAPALDDTVVKNEIDKTMEQLDAVLNCMVEVFLSSRLATLAENVYARYKIYMSEHKEWFDQFLENEQKEFFWTPAHEDDTHNPLEMSANIEQSFFADTRHIFRVGMKKALDQANVACSNLEFAMNVAAKYGIVPLDPFYPPPPALLQFLSGFMEGDVSGGDSETIFGMLSLQTRRKFSRAWVMFRIELDAKVDQLLANWNSLPPSIGFDPCGDYMCRDLWDYHLNMFESPMHMLYSNVTGVKVGSYYSGLCLLAFSTCHLSLSRDFLIVEARSPVVFGTQKIAVPLDGEKQLLSPQILGISVAPFSTVVDRYWTCSYIETADLHRVVVRITHFVKTSHFSSTAECIHKSQTLDKEKRHAESFLDAFQQSVHDHVHEFFKDEVVQEDDANDSPAVLCTATLTFTPNKIVQSERCYLYRRSRELHDLNRARMMLNPPEHDASALLLGPPTCITYTAF